MQLATRPYLRERANTEQLKQDKQQQHQDEIDRIAIEGKFGQGKRRFGLARVMAKLAGTSEVVVMVSFIVMNLEKILSGVLSFLLLRWPMVRNGTRMCLLGEANGLYRVRFIPDDLTSTSRKNMKMCA